MYVAAVSAASLWSRSTVIACFAMRGLAMDQATHSLPPRTRTQGLQHGYLLNRCVAENEMRPTAFVLTSKSARRLPHLILTHVRQEQSTSASNIFTGNGLVVFCSRVTVHPRAPTTSLSQTTTLLRDLVSGASHNYSKRSTPYVYLFGFVDIHPMELRCHARRLHHWAKTTALSRDLLSGASQLIEAKHPIRVSIWFCFTSI